MAWSPPALERRKWFVEQTRDYATNLFPPPSLRHRPEGVDVGVLGNDVGALEYGPVAVCKRVPNSRSR